uniref:SPW repeat-containing integral membrane domain-containing protein n=1 Tax=uncultured bacterium esnapd21 TaxID=1366603 RepID=S5UBV8_9BACT|nr:hypothetical protein [uncultured bacterium esnapd21]
MKLTSPRPDAPVLEYGTFGAGVLLFLTPWLMGFSSEAAPAWNIWGVALGTAAFAVYACTTPSPWWRWTLVAFAAWTLIAPWALAFTASAMAFWTHKGASIVLAVLAALAIWQEDQGRRALTA